MTIKIASAAEIAAKWMEVTPGRQRFYELNTPPAAADWEANTKASESIFNAAITAAGVAKRFVGGVGKAGAAKFARKVSMVGVGRFGPGVQAAGVDMQAGFEPYVSIISGITLPKKGPRGDTLNYARVQAVGDPLHKKRLALLGAG